MCGVVWGGGGAGRSVPPGGVSAGGGSADPSMGVKGSGPPPPHTQGTTGSEGLCFDFGRGSEVRPKSKHFWGFVRDPMAQ